MYRRFAPVNYTTEGNKNKLNLRAYILPYVYFREMAREDTIRPRNNPV
jgi:hypothetical protein